MGWMGIKNVFVFVMRDRRRKISRLRLEMTGSEN